MKNLGKIGVLFPDCSHDVPTLERINAAGETTSVQSSTKSSVRVTPLHDKNRPFSIRPEFTKQSKQKNFPFTHRHSARNPVVVTAEVRKDGIMAYKGERNASEIVTFSARRLLVEVADSAEAAESHQNQ